MAQLSSELSTAVLGDNDLRDVCFETGGLAFAGAARKLNRVLRKEADDWKRLWSVLGWAGNSPTRNWDMQTDRDFRKDEGFIRSPLAMMSMPNKGVMLSCETSRSDNTLRLYTSEARFRMYLCEKGVLYKELGPSGLAIDPMGEFLYVAEGGWVGQPGRVQKLQLPHANSLCASNLAVDGDAGDLVRPTGLVLWENKLFVLDELSCKVLVLDSDALTVRGTFASAGSGRGQLCAKGMNYGMDPGPCGMAIHEDEELLIICDFGNDRLQLFSLAGTADDPYPFVRTLGEPAVKWKWGDPPLRPGELCGPKAVDVGPCGRIFVVDTLGRMQVLTTTGECHSLIDLTKHLESDEPNFTALCVHRHRVFVCDSQPYMGSKIFDLWMHGSYDGFSYDDMYEHPEEYFSCSEDEDEFDELERKLYGWMW